MPQKNNYSLLAIVIFFMLKKEPNRQHIKQHCLLTMLFFDV